MPNNFIFNFEVWPLPESSSKWLISISEEKLFVYLYNKIRKCFRHLLDLKKLSCQVKETSHEEQNHQKESYISFSISTAYKSCGGSLKN